MTERSDKRKRVVKKLKEPTVSIKDILSHDKLRQLADLLVSGEASSIILIFTKGDKLYYGTTIESVPELLGSLELIREKIMEEWWEAGEYPEEEL